MRAHLSSDAKTSAAAWAGEVTLVGGLLGRGEEVCVGVGVTDGVGAGGVEAAGVGDGRSEAAGVVQAARAIASDAGRRMAARRAVFIRALTAGRRM